jgi:hypothetical protein
VVRSLSQGPGSPDAGAGGSEDTDAAEDFRRKAREERSRQAALRKQKVLESFKKKQTKFSEEHKDILGSISTDVETVPSEGSGKSETQKMQVPEGDEAAEVTTSEWSDRMKCAHCSTDREDPLGLVVFILVSVLIYLTKSAFFPFLDVELNLNSNFMYEVNAEFFPFAFIVFVSFSME